MFGSPVCVVCLKTTKLTIAVLTALSRRRLLGVRPQLPPDLNVLIAPLPPQPLAHAARDGIGQRLAAEHAAHGRCGGGGRGGA